MAVLVLVSVLLHVFRRHATRLCPLCNSKVELGRRRCQVCGYLFDESRW